MDKFLNGARPGGVFPRQVDYAERDNLLHRKFRTLTDAQLALVNQKIHRVPLLRDLPDELLWSVLRTYLTDEELFLNTDVLNLATTCQSFKWFLHNRTFPLRVSMRISLKSIKVPTSSNHKARDPQAPKHVLERLIITDDCKNIIFSMANEKNAYLVNLKLRTSGFFKGNRGYIHDLCATPDSQYLVTGSYDRTVRLFSIKSMQLVHTFGKTADSVNAVAVSTNHQLGTTPFAKTLKPLYALRLKEIKARAKERKTSAEGGEGVIDLVSDGEEESLPADSIIAAATGSFEKSIRFFSVYLRKLVKTVKFEDLQFERLEFFQHNDYLLAKEKDKAVVHVVDMETTKVHLSIRATDCAFLDASRLVCCLEARSVFVFDVKQQKRTLCFSNHVDKRNYHHLKHNVQRNEEDARIIFRHPDVVYVYCNDYPMAAFVYRLSPSGLLSSPDSSSTTTQPEPALCTLEALLRFSKQEAGLICQAAKDNSFFVACDNVSMYLYDVKL